MKKVAVIFIIAALIAVIGMSAQNYKRKLPGRQAVSHSASAIKTATVAPDTVPNNGDSVTVSGFEKPLKEKREAMFVTNTATREIEAIIIDIDYYDMSDRQLHHAQHTVRTTIPTSQTRRIEIPSFDRMGVFYYHLSPVPKVRQATPFKVGVTVTGIVFND